jgi:hypothetical protein
MQTDPIYTVDEVAALLKISRWSVIRKFADEAGVIDMGSPLTTKRARRYRILRIPQSVINRVLARRRVGKS